MSDAFISYSRKDAAFVHRLNTAFVHANRVIWVDWQDIPGGEDWWEEIKNGIQNADAFLCVVSENWLMSENCHREMSHAVKNHKRIIWLIRQQIEADIEKRVKGSWMDLPWEQEARSNWEYLRHLNWLAFDQDSLFEEKFAVLLQTLERDQPYIKAHTRYQNLASEWENSGKNPSYLLNGQNLDFAEAWLKASERKEPKSTAQQIEFISRSKDEERSQGIKQAAREKQIRRFRRTAIGLGTIGVLAILAIIILSVIGVQALNKVREAKIEQEINQQWGIANLKLLEKKSGEALEIVNTLVKTYPNNATAYTTRGIIYQYSNQTDKAIIDYTEAIKINPKIAKIYYDRGISYYILGQYDKAIEDYTAAIELDPQFAEAYNGRGNSYGALVQYKNAVMDYDKSIELDPNFTTAYYNRAIIYYTLNQYDKTIQDYTKVIELNPNLAEAYNGRGNAYYALNQYVKAIGDYAKVIEFNPNSTEVYKHRGDSYYVLQEYSNALKDWKQYEALGGILPAEYKAYRATAEQQATPTAIK